MPAALTDAAGSSSQCAAAGDAGPRARAAGLSPEATRGHFGDLMFVGPRSNAHSECCMVDGLSAMERVVLTANGNLQRIMSAYYGAECTVRVLAVEPRGESKWWRSVELVVNGRVFCAAQTDAVVNNPEWAQQVASGEVGLGQLFSRHRMLPYFSLLQAGKEGGVLRRVYRLHTEGFEVTITETFPPGFLELGQGQGPAPPPEGAAPVSQTFGDLMAGKTASVSAPATLPPWGRVLATANGNVQRLLEAHHRCEVEVRLISSVRERLGRWVRRVELCRVPCGAVLAKARSSVSIDDPAVRSEVEAGRISEGAVFRAFNLLPCFELQSAAPTPEGGLQRSYVLHAPERGIRCHIEEEFDPVSLA
eukprot:TRINITY_DN13533_c0_g1_i1.p1 TRINITY_DN13533_c0_g1~~TRINITY_DN13533_c0_g1_i1.p1  ORF type:complete len:398 (+),score=100.90 TRINITY_DN13533_c0_g1_i1:108-1196(+)